jgi:glycosyl transferase family 25
MKGYLINLKKRNDRLERFNSIVTNNLPFISIEVIEALDGTTLDFKDELLVERINNWALKNLNDKLLRGVVGCCISHLECIKRISNGDDNYAIVFEDDCVFKDLNKQNSCNDFLKNLQIPEKFGVIYLNFYVKIPTIKCNNEYLNKVLSGYQTAESYIVSKDFAKIIYNENINNIGAFDAHLEKSMLNNPDYPFYELKNNYFIQYNRRDSNIR